MKNDGWSGRGDFMSEFDDDPVLTKAAPQEKGMASDMFKWGAIAVVLLCVVFLFYSNWS